MSKFEQHIRDYFAERLGVNFYTTDLGFAGYRIEDGTIYLEEFYVEPSTPYPHAFRIARAIIAIGKSAGCTRFVGGNDTSLETYEDIKKLHSFFGMRYSGESNGTLELWVKDI